MGSLPAGDDRPDFLSITNTNEAAKAVFPVVKATWDVVCRGIARIKRGQIPGHPKHDPAPFMRWAASFVRGAHEPTENLAALIHETINREIMPGSPSLRGLRRLGFDPCNADHVAALWYLHVHWLPVLVACYPIQWMALDAGLSTLQATKLCEDVFAEAFPERPTWAVNAWNVIHAAVPAIAKDEIGREIDVFTGPRGRKGPTATEAARSRELGDAWANVATDAWQAFVGGSVPGLYVPKSHFGARAEKVLLAARADGWNRKQRGAAPYVDSSTRPDQRLVREVAVAAVPDARPDDAAPDVLVEAEERRARVQRALATLTDEQRKLLMAIEAEGMSQREVAEQLGVSNHKVARAHDRAMSAFLAAITSDAG